MKNNKTRPAGSNIVVLQQLLKLIPRYLVTRIGRQTGVCDKVRTYCEYSHLVTMIFAQLTHAIGLNDVCDWLRLKARLLFGMGVIAPSRNGLSHANKVRSSDFIEQLFWEVLSHLQRVDPRFAHGRQGRGLLHRFKVRIHAVDSTVMELVANCMDWAQHRRRKAAAKMHLRLDLQSYLPSFAIVSSASAHDNAKAREVCAGLRPGEVVVFDKAYVDFDHLSDLDARAVSWVTRAKDNMVYRVKANLTPSKGNIIKDQLILLTGQNGMQARRVEAWVKVDGEDRKMVFITNNLQWSPNSVCDLYRSRWDIEVFFKQVKQTLKLSSFLGHSANAVRWQVFTALLVYVLLRFLSAQANWSHSFTRLFTCVRAATWERIDLFQMLASYGTAGGRFRVTAAFQQAWFPGFAYANPASHGTA